MTDKELDTILDWQTHAALEAVFEANNTGKVISTTHSSIIAP